MTEEYNEYGEIKPKHMSFDQAHQIHRTKDIFVSDCSLCQQAMKLHIKTYWADDD